MTIHSTPVEETTGLLHCRSNDGFDYRELQAKSLRKIFAIGLPLALSLAALV